KAFRRFRFSTPTEGVTTAARARLTSDGRRLLALGTTTLPPRNSKDLGRHEPVLGWDVATGLEVLSRPVVCTIPYGSSFSPDGSLMLLGESGTLLDLTPEPAAPIPWLKLSGLGPPFVFSPDGRFLAAVEPGRYPTPSKALHVHEVLTGRRVAEMEAPLGLP